MLLELTNVEQFFEFLADLGKGNSSFSLILQPSDEMDFIMPQVNDV